MDKMATAGCTVVGGHSIDGPEPTYGFAVTGLADAIEVVTNAGARPGDVIVLTKPLGIGIITTAIKRGACPAQLARTAVEQMATLNDVAGAALGRHDVNAATDVTGFGLLGHLREVCRASGVGAEVDLDVVPVLDGALDLLAAGMWAGGSARNLRSLLPDIETSRSETEIKPLADAQTSGGLLVALPERSVEGYLADVPGTSVIGRITSDEVIRVA
jgi:selenide,water dikinase